MVQLLISRYQISTELCFIMKNTIQSIAVGWERKRGSAYKSSGSEGVHESYAQCGCAARDSGEFVTASGGYLRRAGGCIPGLTHFFVEYYLCTPSGCKYSCGTRAHTPCIALPAANRNKCSSCRLKFQPAKCALVVLATLSDRKDTRWYFIFVIDTTTIYQDSLLSILAENAVDIVDF